MTDVNVKVGRQTDPELQREKLESDRRRIIEIRANELRLIPNDLAGLTLTGLTPLASGFGVGSILSALSFPPFAVASVGLFVLISGGAIAFHIRNSKHAQIGFYILLILLTIGFVGGINGKNLEPIAVSSDAVSTFK